MLGELTWAPLSVDQEAPSRSGIYILPNGQEFEITVSRDLNFSDGEHLSWDWAVEEKGQLADTGSEDSLDEVIQAACNYCDTFLQRSLDADDAIEKLGNL